MSAGVTIAPKGYAFRVAVLKRFGHADKAITVPVLVEGLPGFESRADADRAAGRIRTGALVILCRIPAAVVEEERL